MDNFSNKYQYVCKIEEGSYGVVWKANTSNNQFVAIKHIKLGDGFNGFPQTALREVSNLRNLSNHQSVVKLRDIDYKFQEKSIKLVFDYYHYNLKSFCEIRQEEIDEIAIRRMVRQLVSGVAYCHEKKIIHRDLKPQNILVDLNGNIKIADFGLSRVCNTENSNLTLNIQTLNYKAPEILLGDVNYNISIDIWSIGCIFAQLFQKKLLFDGKSQIEQLFKIFQLLGSPTQESWQNCKNLPHFKSTFPKWKKQPLKDKLPHIPEDALDLLQKMLEVNPSKRISAVQALEHKYLKEDGVKLETQEKA